MRSGKLVGFLTLALAAMMFAVASASAWNFSINGTSVGVDPASGESSLYSYSTTYHYNTNTSARNQAYPGYEYQYEGEYVDFWATIQDFSQYNVMNMFVQAHLNCIHTGNQYYVNLTRTSEPTFVNGKYQAQYHGIWQIPPALTEVSNCRIIIEMTTPGGVFTFDDLSNSLYTNVNDVLVNPQLSFWWSSAFAFTPTTYNAYNPSTPLFVDYQLFSDITDREGTGVIGDLEVEMPRFRGCSPTGTGAACPSGGFLIMTNNTGDVFPASNVRFHLDTQPSGVYTQLVDRNPPLSAWAEVVDKVHTEAITGGAEGPGRTQPIRLFWELYYSQLFTAPNGYISDPTAFNGGNILFTFRIV